MHSETSKWISSNCFFEGFATRSNLQQADPSLYHAIAVADWCTLELHKRDLKQLQSSVVLLPIPQRPSKKCTLTQVSTQVCQIL